MLQPIYWHTIRGFIGGLIAGIVVVLGLMWTAGDLDRWQSRLVSISLTIVLFAVAGAVGGFSMGKKSS